MLLSASKPSAKTGPVGALNAPVRAPIMNLVFSRQTYPIHSIRPQNQARVLSHVLVSFKNQRENGPRRCIKCTRSCADYETSVFTPNISKPLHYNQKPSSSFISCFGHLKNGRENGPCRRIKCTGSCTDYKTCVLRQACPIQSITSKNQIWGCISCFGQLQKPARKRAP